MKLYRVALKVRPTPAHPLYWQIQFGYLLVWLLSAQAYRWEWSETPVTPTVAGAELDGRVKGLTRDRRAK